MTNLAITMSEIDRQAIRKLKEGVLLAFGECFFNEKSESSTQTVVQQQ